MAVLSKNVQQLQLHSIPHGNKFQLDVKMQLVGRLDRYLTENTLKDELHTVYPHNVLIIQPRKKSVYFGCRYNFEDVLNWMYLQAQSDQSDRHILTSTLGEVLAFCRQNPFRVWNDPSGVPGVRARRLMDLCTHLQAEKEGLQLLSILGDDFELAHRCVIISPDQPQLFFEGVQNDQVVDSIVNFECQVTGNSRNIFRIIIIGNFYYFYRMDQRLRQVNP